MEAANAAATPVPSAGAAAVALPVAGVIATADRPASLARCFASLRRQEPALQRLIVVDASADERTARLCDEWFPRLGAGTRVDASIRGAAAQRNRAVRLVDQPFVLFLDDDVELGPGCLAALWEAMDSDGRIGGVSSMIENQQFTAPGLFTRLVLRIAGSGGDAFPAGRCLAPAFNILPADRPDFPPIVPVEWLNTTCTLYRTAALPSEPFAPHFTGYSYGEDLDLSLRVGRSWRLVNARTARIVHHSESAAARDVAAAAEMTLVNRHYIMTRTLGRTSRTDHARLAGVELLLTAAALTRRSGWRELPAVLRGKLRGVRRLRRSADR